VVSRMMRQQAAIEKIKSLLGERQANECSVQFELVRTFKRANKLFSRISEATDGETIKDHLAEVRYALIFNDLGFVVGFDPPGLGKVPDLEIERDGVEVIAEVKHFRASSSCFEESTLKDDDLLLQPCGDSLKHIKKMHDKFADTLTQLEDRTSIAAFWDDYLDDLEADQFARETYQNFVMGTFEHSDRLLFVVYGTEWFNISRFKQLFCYPVRGRLEEPFNSWMRELEDYRI
jgi:hypothetical protein